MSCCGPNISLANGKKKLEALNNFKNKRIILKLKPQYKLEFDPEQGSWFKKYEEISKINQKEIDEAKKCNDLEQKILQQYKEIESLQKKYLEKMAKLLLMTQAHCQIKDSILDSFNKSLSKSKDDILNDNINFQYDTKVKTVNENDVNVDQFYDEPIIQNSVIKGTEMVPTN